MTGKSKAEILHLSKSALEVRAEKVHKLKDDGDLEPRSSTNQTSYKPNEIQNHGGAVGQMISQRHTTNFILYWLTSWKNMSVVRNEVVTEDSPALLGALVNAFTSFITMKAYISRSICMRFGVTRDLSECYLIRS